MAPHIAAVKLASAMREYLWPGAAPSEDHMSLPVSGLWQLALTSPSWMSPVTMMRRVLAFAGLVATSLQASVKYRLTNTTGPDLTAPLTFGSDGTFQISIFEDLHFGESELYYNST